MNALREVQHAMAASIVGGAPAPRALLRHPRLDPGAALAIHRRHFLTSLRDSLAATFPAVARLVGEGFFAYAAYEFATRHPPKSPCLADYGRDLPGFLAGFAPCAHLAYLPDVARLEWLLHEAGSAPAAERCGRDVLAQIPPDRIATLRLELDPSLRFLATRWPVDTLVERARATDDVAGLVIEPRSSFLQVRRTCRDTRTVRLSPGAFAFRTALAAATPIEIACDRAIAVDPDFDIGRAVAALLADGAVAGFTSESSGEARP